jgi:hypothetical protein
MKLLVIAPALLVLISLCGSPVPAPSTPTSTPQPTPSPDLSGVPACRASDLSVTWHAERSASAHGHSDRVDLTNTSGAACQLDWTPDLILRSADGWPPDVTLNRYRACFPGLSCPDHQVPVLSPASECAADAASCSTSAYFEVSWLAASGDYSGECRGQPPTVAVDQFVLPNGQAMALNVEQRGTGQGVADEAIEFQPWCNVIEVGPILPASHLTDWGQFPVEVNLQPTTDRPEGATYAVTVVLTNTTKQTLSFTGPCPIVTLELAMGTPGHAGYASLERQRGPLDCTSRGPILPERTASFAYTIAVPADLPGDPSGWKLLWYVEDGSDPRTLAEGGGFLPAPTPTPAG